MTLTDTVTLLAFIISLLMLLVTVAHAAFDIAWKISQEKQDRKNKKD